MLSLANANCKTSQRLSRPAVQRCTQHAHGTPVVRRIKSHRRLGSDWTPKDAASIAHAVPSGKDARDAERAALLGKRAATVCTIDLYFDRYEVPIHACMHTVLHAVVVIKLLLMVGVGLERCPATHAKCSEP